DSPQQLTGFLGGIAGSLPRRRGHDRLPPHICRQLAGGPALARLQSGRHVRDAIDACRVEVVLAGVAGVHEDDIVLGGPPPPWSAAEVIGPDDLVDEAATS